MNLPLLITTSLRFNEVGEKIPSEYDAESVEARERILMARIAELTATNAELRAVSDLERDIDTIADAIDRLPYDDEIAAAFKRLRALFEPDRERLADAIGDVIRRRVEGGFISGGTFEACADAAIKVFKGETP